MSANDLAARMKRLEGRLGIEPPPSPPEPTPRERELAAIDAEEQGIRARRDADRNKTISDADGVRLLGLAKRRRAIQREET